MEKDLGDSLEKCSLPIHKWINWSPTQSSICTELLKLPGENEPVHTENGLSCVVSVREKVEG